MTDLGTGRRDGTLPLRVRLPGFVDEEIGMGDVVKKVTYRAGLSPCRGCEQRAETMNRWLVFSGRPAR
ncbi:hypothetical protein AB0M19_31460 [Streptomyces sp. NPDC051920]|uniref:hypothetical protein n=1 Tax=Streptomyces sp. NPDC051920 TaxID=3155523 RepID=UPI00343599FF